MVEAPEGERVLRVGEPGPLAGAFITAWNPASVPAAPEVNSRRQAALTAAVQRRGYEFLLGRGEGCGWTEESILILGIGREEALELARAFGQAAIVYVVATGAPAEIIWA